MVVPAAHAHLREEAPRFGQVARHAVRVSAQPGEARPLEQDQGEPTLQVSALLRPCTEAA